MTDLPRPPSQEETPPSSQALDLWLDEVGSWLQDWGDTQWEERVVTSTAHNLNEFGYDSFGMSPAFLKKVIPFVRFLYRVYFRVRSHGTRNIPGGRVMLVSNHSGQLPFDGMLIAAAVALEGDPPRILRSMVERWVPTLPFVNLFMARCGQVLGDPANSRRLLENEEAVLVFPEGIKGISKTWAHRYQLQDFGYGFMRLALETNTPIVPVATVGMEEAVPTFFNYRPLARLLGIPAFPITPTFPWIFPLGLTPYPVKVHVLFGEPIRFRGDPNEEDEVIGKKVDRVKSEIDALLKQGLKKRSSLFRW